MTAASLGKTVRQFIERESLRPDLARATRATVGFMIPLALQSTVGLPVEVIFACISAQSIAMLDVRGDYRLRISGVTSAATTARPSPPRRCCCFSSA
jgi:hypothetical protein